MIAYCSSLCSDVYLCESAVPISVRARPQPRLILLMLAMTLDFPHDFPALIHVNEHEYFAAAFDVKGLTDLFPLVFLPVEVRIHCLLLFVNMVPRMLVVPSALSAMLRPVQVRVTYSSYVIFLLTTILRGPCE